MSEVTKRTESRGTRNGKERVEGNLRPSKEIMVVVGGLISCLCGNMDTYYGYYELELALDCTISVDQSP